ncbi:putative DDE superfamily endonuclease [Blattamonas nauphoetae]|uniref:DDE superfamily endonuclease n=1 Tax=Blattamonas nauphoetae TaxID=2049346 RepID=A0ABQ9X4C4_9EUKA|nr:putative DDE superfamily endonuclease [Blattamonas nauphoetae]
MTGCDPSLVRQIRAESDVKKEKKQTNTSLTEEQEAGLVELATKKYLHGKRLSIMELKDEAAQRCNHRVGHSWHEGFFSRHPEVKSLERHPREERRMNLAGSDIRKYQRILERNLRDIPIWFVFHADESGYQAFHDGTTRKVVVPTDTPVDANHFPVDRDEKRISILACIGLDRNLDTPYFCVPPPFSEDLALIEGLELSTDYEYGLSNKGGMTSELFADWLNRVFIPLIAMVRKVCGLPDKTAVLLLDGCGAHVSEGAMNLCTTNNVRPITPPGNTTHLLQVLDLGIFAPFKRYVQSLREGQHHDSTEHMVAIAEAALTKACDKITIRHAFERGGIDWDTSHIPFTATKIPKVFQDASNLAVLDYQEAKKCSTNSQK